jgi:phosphatidylserine/phosphatidylglycerophosphate/cardiolipin synthase-like enzyme
MIIDGETVITGSFNFTKAAEENNAENLLVIRGIRNWLKDIQGIGRSMRGIRKFIAGRGDRRKQTGYNMPKLLDEEITDGRFNTKGSPRFNQGKVWDSFNRCWDFN